MTLIQRFKNGKMVFMIKCEECQKEIRFYTGKKYCSECAKMVKLRNKNRS